MAAFVDSAECTQIDADVPSSVERSPTHAEMAGLLRSVASEMRPGEGCPKALAHVLRVLRRCPWLEGELRMVLTAEGSQTSVHLYTEHAGARERALPSVVVDVPLDEFEETLHHAPDLFAPLRMRHEKQRLVFTTSGTTSSAHPPAVLVGSERMPHEHPTTKRAALRGK